jgi:hypothetical protein
MTPWRRIGEVEVYLHTFLTSALDGGEWQLHAPAALPSGKEPRYPLDRRLTYEGVSKSFRTGRLARELQMVQLSATRCSCITIFFSQSSEFCRHNPLCYFSTNVCCCKRIFHYRLIPETFGYTPVKGANSVFRICDRVHIFVNSSNKTKLRARKIMSRLISGNAYYRTVTVSYLRT